VPRLGHGFRLQWEPAQNCHVLLYPEGMVKLNGSAGEIMQRIDGKKTIAALITELETAFDATGLQADVLAFLDIANAQGWVKP
jgi:pyrroloquinoline quinone biosynthesis protein D